MFVIYFVTVILAVIGLVDNALLSLLAANSPSDNAFSQALHIAGNGGGLEFFIINLLILFFYLIAIKLWFGFMEKFGDQMMKSIRDNGTGMNDMELGQQGYDGAKSVYKYGKGKLGK